MVDGAVGRDRARRGRRRRSPYAGGAGRAHRAAAAIRRRSHPATRVARAHAAGAAALPSAALHRVRRGSRACCCGGTTGVHPDGAGGTPPEARGADRTRCSRRTRKRRGRSSRKEEARPRRSPRRAGTRCRTRPDSDEPSSSCAGVTSTPTGRAPRSGEPRGDVGRAAAELDDVEAVDVPERVERGLGHPEDAPGDLLGQPRSRSLWRRCSSAFACVQSSRFRFASSEMSVMARW